MLRILHILDHSIPLHSGYAFRTLSILEEQRRRGWQTHHLTSPKQGATGAMEETVDGWHFFRTAVPAQGASPVPGSGEIRLMRAVATRLHEVAERVRPHVLHAHSPVLNALPTLWVGRRLGLPVVYEMRASWEDAAVDHGTTREGSLRYRLSRAIETFALKRADQVTTICEGLKGDIVARGIDEARVTIIPNAVDVHQFCFDRPASSNLRAKLGLEHCVVLGFAGSFYGYEGLDLLLAAAAKLAQSAPGVRVLLVGGGPQDAALKAQAKELGIADRVIFTGRVPHAEVDAYYDAIDILVYPRKSIRLTELVTPLKPLEAMAQGRVLIASDVGGHRELVRDGVTGMLFEAGSVQALADAITRMLATRERWPALRAAGRRFVETERTWSRSVARYADVYARLRPDGSIRRLAEQEV